MRVRVAVVGGGISGLAAAWEMATSRPDVHITVLEGSGSVGGKLRLAQVAGAEVDVGAESVLARRPEALELMAELGLTDEIVHPAPVGASIVAHGRRWPMPRGTVMGVPADPASVRGILTDAEIDRLRDERDAPPVSGDVAVGEYVARRLGRAVTDRLVEPLLAGVYAGHSRELSLELSVPALYEVARRGGSLLEAARSAAGAGASVTTPVFASLRGGLGTLPQVLSRRLTGLGVTLRRGTTARAIRRLDGTDDGWSVTTGPTTDERHESYDGLVLATPAASTARLLAATAPESAALLAGIEYASMAIVTLALDETPGCLIGSSGFLVPPTEPLRIKASTFSSSKWPALADRAPDVTYLRASIGRHREAASLQHPDAELVATALADLERVLETRLPRPLATHVQRWGGALPQYAVGHRERVGAVRRGLPERVVVCGAAYDGVGIPACIGSGRAAARALLAHLPA